MQRRGMTLRELCVLLVVFGGFVWLMIPWGHLGNGRRSAERIQCQNKLKQIILAYDAYLQDYDDKLPLISDANNGWASTLNNYDLRGSLQLDCLSAEQSRVPGSSEYLGSSDYFLNARVASLKRSQISFGAQTILLGDGIDNGSTNSHFSELPFDWKITENSPARRHLDGANYAFVDGHVKWLKPEKVSVESPVKNRDVAATFAVK